MDAFSIHACAQGIQPRFRGSFELTIHSAGEPPRRDSESGEEGQDYIDIRKRMFFKVPGDTASIIVFLLTWF